MLAACQPRRLGCESWPIRARCRHPCSSRYETITQSVYKTLSTVALADVALPAGQGWGVSLMKDSSVALGQPVRSSRLQTLATVELPRNRRSDEVLHADVVLAGPKPQPLDQRTRELRCQRFDWFVSFDTRARHSARIRPPADGPCTRPPLPGHPGYRLTCMPHPRKTGSAAVIP